ncbi:MAG TPA: cytochrome c biogenesis protein CcdA [Streptosporangiaceae bacterium]
MSIGSLVSSGPLIVAMPIAAAAGAITFLSPCCLPLIPGYLSYVTGMSGADAQRATAAGRREISGTETAGTESADRGTAGGESAGRGRTVTGTLLFVLGFSALFAAYGAASGGLGSLLQAHQRGLIQVLGGLTILLGLLFAGLFDRFTFAARMLRPSVRPRAGLAGAPLLGVLFGIGWTPCTGPTLSAVLALAATTGTAGRGAFLLFIYGLGLGVPFLIVATVFQRGITGFGFARRNAKAIMQIGGGLLIIVGILQVSGAWTEVLNWLRLHWTGGYNLPI